MATSERRFVIRNIAPDASTWTALTIPLGCNYAELVNQTTQDVTVRTQSGDSSTGMTIKQGESYLVSFDAALPQGATRFLKGDIIGYFQLNTSGSGNVCGVFTV